MDKEYPTTVNDPGCVVCLVSDPERIGIVLDNVRRSCGREYRLVRFVSGNRFVPVEILRICKATSEVEVMHREFCLKRYGVYRSER